MGTSRFLFDAFFSTSCIFFICESFTSYLFFSNTADERFLLATYVQQTEISNIYMISILVLYVTLILHSKMTVQTVAW